MEPVDAPRGGHRRLAPGLPRTARCGSGILSRMPQILQRGMLILHRTYERKAADEVPRRHNRRSLETQGAGRQEPPRRRADVHRVLRLGSGFARAYSGPGEGGRPLRRAPIARIRRPPCRQCQCCGHSIASRGVGTGPRDAGEEMHSGERPSPWHGIGRPARCDGEQPQQHGGPGHGSGARDQQDRWIERLQRHASAAPGNQHNLRTGRRDRRVVRYGHGYPDAHQGRGAHGPQDQHTAGPARPQGVLDQRSRCARTSTGPCWNAWRPTAPF